MCAAATGSRPRRGLGSGKGALPVSSARPLRSASTFPPAGPRTPRSGRVCALRGGVIRRLPLFGSSSSAVLSQLVRCLQNWKGAAEGGGTDFSPENWLPPRLLSCQVVVLAAYSPPFNPPYLIRKRWMRKVLSGTGQTGQLGKGCQLSFYSYTLGNSSLSIWETLYRAFSC